MIGNSRGGRRYKTNRWVAFEKLPPEVRRRLANADNNYSSVRTLSLVRRYGVEYTLKRIEQWERWDRLSHRGTLNALASRNGGCQ
jgi:hypothetical protein